MKDSVFKLVLSMVALLLAGCASEPRVFHTSKFYDLVLSPQSRTNSEHRVTLLSISRNGRVTIRSQGTVYSARIGESFRHLVWHLDCTLKSVNTETGRIVITYEVHVW